MWHTPVWNFLHAGDASSQSQPPLADYPISLLTRRTLGEMAGSILAQRQHAPQAVPMRPTFPRLRAN